jgi:integrase
MQRVERATEIRDEVEIFTPEEGQWIMDAAVELDNRMVGYFALALFCGIRHSEIERLHWPDVDLVAKAAFVAKGKVKRAGHRIVPIAPNAVAWLERYGKKHGPVCPVEEMTNRIRVLKNHIRKTHPGFRWVKNGPRHSYVSYRLAVTQNIPQVSEETQSAIGTLRKHYLRPVLKEVGERWFGIGLGGQYPS